jgi:hypothetical protein
VIQYILQQSYKHHIFVPLSFQYLGKILQIQIQNKLVQKMCLKLLDILYIYLHPMIQNLDRLM